VDLIFEGQNVTLVIISFASMIAGIACNIQNRKQTALK
jgi:hypothetical protein